MAAPFNIPAHTTIYRVPRNFYPPWLDEWIAASYLSPRYSRSKSVGGSAFLWAFRLIRLGHSLTPRPHRPSEMRIGYKV